MTKACSKCGVEKGQEEFWRCAGTSDGLNAWCKTCHRAWREEHREQVRENERRRYAADPERGRDRQRKWAAQNRELVNERARQAYYENDGVEYARQLRRKNLERSRAAVRKCYRRNRAKRLDWAHRRRLVVESGGVSSAVLDALLTQPCSYCDATERIELDHVIPLSRGGTHDESNLTSACRSCNASKGARLLSEWLGVTA